ncbi:8451_t:CDS:2, partial [Cetraspora pellucida]
YTAKRQTVFMEHSEDDFDITEYFKESFHFTKNINDITKDIEVISLKEGDSFDNFDEAKLHIRRFAEYRGFKIRLGHVKMLDTTENVKEIRKRTILCKHSSMFKQKNVEKQNDTHNYDLLLKVIQFEKNKQFTDEMRKEIEFLVTKCRLGATIKEKTNTLINLFWMSSEQIILWCEFNEAIGHDNTVGTNRYNMPFSLFVIQDNNMQSRIVAQAFVSNESTETYQWVLRITKKAMNNRCHKFCKVLMERSSEKQKRKKFEEWKRSIPSMVNTTTIFSTIKSLVKCYLRVNVAYFLVEQMKETLYYTASHATIKEIESLTSYESSQSKDIDNEPDAIILCATYLLKHLEQTSIVKIWKISRVTSHGINHFIFLFCGWFAQFSLQLIAPRWIPKQQRLDVVKEYPHLGQHFNNIKNTTTDTDMTLRSNMNQHVWLQPFA